MSMVLARSPLEPIGMNGAGGPKRRSARLSAEGAEENEPPAKKSKANGVQSSVVSTKEQDGDAGAASRKKRKGKPSHHIAAHWELNAMWMRRGSLRCGVSPTYWLWHAYTLNQGRPG